MEEGDKGTWAAREGRDGKGAGGENNSNKEGTVIDEEGRKEEHKRKRRDRSRIGGRNNRTRTFGEEEKMVKRENAEM